MELLWPMYPRCKAGLNNRQCLYWSRGVLHDVYIAVQLSVVECYDDPEEFEFWCIGGSDLDPPQLLQSSI